MFKADDFRLSFSTWAAPGKTIPQLVEAAKAWGYAGVELVMGGPGASAHAHGLDADTPPGRLAEARHTLASSGVDVSCVSPNLPFGPGQAPVDELKRYVALAETLGCKCVRIQGPSLSRERGELAGLIDSFADAIADAITFAEQSSVSILLDTTDDFASTKYVREVVKQVYSERFGVLWDVAATFRALETVEEAFDNISGQVRHVHVADFRYAEGRTKVVSVPLAEGEVPFAAAIGCLARDGFEGFLSLDMREGVSDELLAQGAKVLAKLVAEAFSSPVEIQK